MYSPYLHIVWLFFLTRLFLWYSLFITHAYYILCLLYILMFIISYWTFSQCTWIVSVHGLWVLWVPSFIYLCLIVSFYKLYIFHSMVVNKLLAKLSEEALVLDHEYVWLVRILWIVCVSFSEFGNCLYVLKWSKIEPTPILFAFSLIVSHCMYSIQTWILCEFLAVDVLIVHSER